MKPDYENSDYCGRSVVGILLDRKQHGGKGHVMFVFSPVASNRDGHIDNRMLLRLATLY